MPEVLSLNGFGAAFGARVVLNQLDLCIASPGVVVLMGPTGTGKSTLLRTLAGVNDLQPTFRTWGELRLNGEYLTDSNRPALVGQHYELLASSVREYLSSALTFRSNLTVAEQRDFTRKVLTRFGIDLDENEFDANVVQLPLEVQATLALARASVNRPSLYCIDELYCGKTDDDAQLIRTAIQTLALDAPVLVVTHNQRFARSLGGKTVLLAGGMVQAIEPTEEFFTRSDNPLVARFVRTGGCDLPSPGTPPEHLDPESARPPTVAPVNMLNVRRAPSGFYWLFPNRLAGMPRPGLLEVLDADLAAIRDLNVDLLITLEEEPTVASSDAARFDIEVVHFPIVDMEPPDLESGAALGRKIEAWLAEGRVIAVHCKAGMGRTGTVLAAQLVWRGDSPVQALERARMINPRWVQSESQLRYIREVGDRCLNP